MDIYKFSLPEGCDLKLRTAQAQANLVLMYKGTNLYTMASFILGEKVSLRRGILGSAIVVSSPDPFYYYDQTKKIRNLIANYSTGYEELNVNLRHFEGMPINPMTTEMIRSQAQQTFRQTAERMRREPSLWTTYPGIVTTRGVV